MVDKEKNGITVIIPAYNAENQLSRSIESVVNQTFKKLQILVIDDGSTDRTGVIADNYAAVDARITVLHVKNGGEAKSRNLGLSHAIGEYIAFCDADDYMHSDMLEKLYNAIQKDVSDMAVCAWKNVDEMGDELKWSGPNLKTGVMSSIEAQSMFLQSGNIEGFCWNKLFRRELYKIAETKYDEKRLSFCDILANFQLIKTAKRVSYIGEQLYDYYQISTACTHMLNPKKDYDYREVIDEVYHEAVESGLKKEAKVYRNYRLNRYLYNMYKNRKFYDMDFLRDYLITTYKGHLNADLIQLFIWAIKYPLENPTKYIIKLLIVRKFYYSCQYKL